MQPKHTPQHRSCQPQKSTGDNNLSRQWMRTEIGRLRDELRDIRRDMRDQNVRHREAMDTVNHRFVDVLNSLQYLQRLMGVAK